MAISELPAVIQALGVRDNVVKKIAEVYQFDHTCQGDRPVTCTLVEIYYRPNVVDPDDELPVTVVVVDDPVLGKGAHGSDNASDARVADELINALCGLADCKNGASCVKKRQKIE